MESSKRGLTVIDVTHDGDHRWTRDAFGWSSFFTRGSFRNFFRSLLFEGDHICLRSEVARHLAGEFGIQRLVDGGEYATHQQACNQIFGAKTQLLARSLTLIPSVIVMLRVIGCGSLESDSRGGGV